MAKKKESFNPEATPTPEFVNVTAINSFRWVYDRLYQFESGKQYNINYGLYHQAQANFELVNAKPEAKPEPITEINNQENKDE
jgi:hypothetical protein